MAFSPIGSPPSGSLALVIFPSATVIVTCTAPYWVLAVGPLKVPDGAAGAVVGGAFGELVLGGVLPGAVLAGVVLAGAVLAGALLAGAVVGVVPGPPVVGAVDVGAGVAGAVVAGVVTV